MATLLNLPVAKLRQPAPSLFWQQKLPSTNMHLSGIYIPIIFSLIAIIFLFIGLALLYVSKSVEEISIDYTNCTAFPDSGTMCSSQIAQGISCSCRVPVSVERPLKNDVYVFYALSKFYQNHRLYIESKDELQLAGQVVNASDPPVGATWCGVAFSQSSPSQIPVAPCGLAANSMFNDSFALFTKSGTRVPLTSKGIASKSTNFRNPSNATLQEAFRGYTKPSNWPKNLWEMDDQDADNNGLQNVDFIVWMRTAALAPFRKLYRKVDRSGEGFESGLPAGEYELRVEYNFPVSSFGGTKRVVIANTSPWLGVKNHWVGASFLAVGAAFLVLTFWSSVSLWLAKRRKLV